VKKSILIASNSDDSATCQPVADMLTRRGYNVLTYEANKVATGAVDFCARVGPSGLEVTYDSTPIRPESIVAGWYRRPSSFFAALSDKGRQLCLDKERVVLQYALWDLIPASRWLNAPAAIRHAEHKLIQLPLAQRIGFTIPDTIVTNGWNVVQETLPEQILFKSTYSHLYTKNKMQFVWATPLKNSPETLPTKGNPFPGLWQPYLQKTREWRITIVGDQSFDAVIYTDKTAKDDWARCQHTSSVRFERGEFPAAEKQKCFKFLREFGLRFGAFDFIETPDGQIIFLECNPNGQYGWLEDELELPISKAIADELAAIADKS